jgi:lipoprotein-releasing system permease protein
VRAHPDVVGAAPFVEVQGMLVNGSQVSGALIRGIIPTEEDQVAELRRDMVAGSVDDLVDGEFRIILGQDLANFLGVMPGDKVTVVTPQVSATPVGIMPRLKRFTVSGVFSVGMADYDRNAAFMQMDDAAKLLSLGDAVSGVRLKLTDMWLAPRLSRDIAYELGGVYRVLDWTQVHSNFFSALAMEKRMMSIILFLIVAVAAFNIVSTLVMVVTDKQADIAVLRTLGASPARIMAIFMVQGTAIGLVGTLIGMVAGRDPGAQCRDRRRRDRGALRRTLPGSDHLLHQRAALGRASRRRAVRRRRGLPDVRARDHLSGLACGRDPAGRGPAL